MKQHKDKCTTSTQTDDDAHLTALKILEEINDILEGDRFLPEPEPVTMLGYPKNGLFFQFRELFKPIEPVTYADAEAQTDDPYEATLERGRVVRGELDKVKCVIQ